MPRFNNYQYTHKPRSSKHSADKSGVLRYQWYKESDKELRKVLPIPQLDGVYGKQFQISKETFIGWRRKKVILGFFLRDFFLLRTKDYY